MLGSPYSSQDSHDRHMRALLDQRTSRADPSRFSALSQFSDTPSHYSRAYCSPNTSDRGDRETFTTEYLQNDTRLPGDNFNDHRQISTLNFSDDRHSATSSPEIYDDDPHSFEDQQEDSRVDYLGPKMRFHSRAPWELGDSAVEEEDEHVESPKHLGFSFPFRGSAKGGSSNPHSPRFVHSTLGRPSGDSFRSVPPKRSFDTISSQLSSRGALYALAQEGLSATSLSRPTGPAPKDNGLIGKFIGRTRPSNAQPPSIITPSAPSSPVRSYGNSRLAPQPTSNTTPLEHGNSNNSLYDSHITDLTYQSEEPHVVHPYANPDLIVTYDADPAPLSPTLTQNSSVTRNSSNVTVTQAYSPSESRAVHDTNVLSQSSSSSISRVRMSTIHGKGISSPIAVQGSLLPGPISNDPQFEYGSPGVTNLHGWTDRVVPPSFNLISLEEARAQRARNSALPGDSTQTISSSASIASKSTTTPAYNDSSNAFSPSSSVNSRVRGRTVSTGSKARSAIQSMVGSVKSDRSDFEGPVSPHPTNPPQPPKLKHRKSGFLRLFNGGKDKEEEALPPVPHISSDLQSISRKFSVPNFPSRESIPDRNERLHTSVAASLKPTPPTLSINTGSQPYHNRGAVSDEFKGLTDPPGPARPWLLAQPQSAPADVAVFPPLRLRPISGLFSAQFGEHIIPEFQSNASGSVTDVETPTTSSPQTIVSPLTPAPTETFLKPDSEDQSTTIKALRAQLSSLKATSERQIWELEGQVRELKGELEGLRMEHRDSSSHCNECGRGIWTASPRSNSPPSSGVNTPNSGRSVINRPRAKTGTSSRFVNAHS
ncbi:hypothetical protein FA15DRAFT_662831 [Coprinopsis marcescibilis]|uniref:Uncharacterized protein n=1 Tax=Coprinopsis marcescibilis TaxID=230819 RepID=A0A5C3LPX6_COPMA|nr:hypothetical protein FA15DRAFT_662831 [Coprinopsis marcescibilis]